MIWQDFKYALRLLSKKPGFTALTTLVMAAGIGLSVYMFSFFNTILYKDLPFEDGASLMVVSGSYQGKRDRTKVSLHDYLEIRENVQGLSEFGAYRFQNIIISGRDGARRFSAVFAEANIFQLTRTDAILGRTYTAAEDSVGAEAVVVIGFDLWQSQFAGDESVLKKTLRINGNSHRIIGVMPQGYLFPHSAQIWLPLAADATKLSRSDTIYIRGLAHLNEGVSKDNINSQIAVIMSRIEQQYPEKNSGIGAYIATIPGSGGSGGEPVIYTMHIVAVLILILASINVGNLLLSRALERGKETAIRVALGAPRSRLISQMLWESIIICTLGGLIGFLVMAWGLEVTNPIVETFYADPLAFWWTFGIDGYTIKLFVTIVLVTIILTGFIPAWRNSGGDFNAVLRDGTRGALGKKAGRLNKILVTSEIFISMTVLIASAVMVLSAYEQTHKDMGAETDRTLVANVLLTEKDYGSPKNKVQFAKALQTSLENSVGIDKAMIASALPGHYSGTPNIAIQGREYGKNGNASYPRANYISIMPDSLAKLGVELYQGRYFNNGDDGLDKGTVLVTDSFSKLHFPEQSALGKQIRIVDSNSKQHQWLTIVGVVEHTIQGSREGEPASVPSIFRPFTQLPTAQLTIAMVYTSNANLAAKSLRKALQGIDSELASYRIESYLASNVRITAPIIFISNLTALFALAAVVLAGSGIYGVMSNTINQRIQEIGVKRALGATEQRITFEFLWSGFKLLLWGGVPGIVVGGFMGFAMNQMFGTESSALILIFVTMVVIVASAVMVATFLPTRRTLQLEPSQALHYE